MRKETEMGSGGTVDHQVTGPPSVTWWSLSRVPCRQDRTALSSLCERGRHGLARPAVAVIKRRCTATSAAQWPVGEGSARYDADRPTSVPGPNTRRGPTIRSSPSSLKWSRKSGLVVPAVARPACGWPAAWLTRTGCPPTMSGYDLARQLTLTLPTACEPERASLRRDRTKTHRTAPYRRRRYRLVRR
jgi:hypothetical protein